MPTRRYFEMTLMFRTPLAKGLLSSLMLAIATVPAPAMAQRDPAYDAARKAVR